MNNRKINQGKKLKALYTENYKTLVRKIKDLNKWRDIPGLWIGRLNIIKIVILFQPIYRSTIPINPRRNFFVEIDQLNLNLI